MNNKPMTEAELLQRIARGEDSRQQFKRGKTNRRNPTLAEHAFRLLPYRGLGSGIPRALKEWPQIDLISEERGNQFSAVVQRPLPQWHESAAPHAEAQAPATDPVTPQVTDPVTRLLLALAQGPLSTSEI